MEANEWAESREQAGIKSTERFPSYVIFLYCYLGPFEIAKIKLLPQSFAFQALFLFVNQVTMYHRI